MASEPDSASQALFLDLLKRELETFRKFHHILNEEQAALISNDADRLLALAQQKNEFVTALSQMAQRRNHMLLDRVGQENQLGIETWCKQLEQAGAAKVEATWTALIDQATRAKEQNQINGQLINTRLVHNQQALGILMGVNTVADSLYGKNGQAYTATSPSSGRPLGKA